MQHSETLTSLKWISCVHNRGTCSLITLKKTHHLKEKFDFLHIKPYNKGIYNHI